MGPTIPAGSSAFSTRTAFITLAFSGPETRTKTRAAALITGRVSVSRSGIAAAAVPLHGQKPAHLNPMIDLHAHYGRERKMVTYEDLMGVLEKDKATVDKADHVKGCEKVKRART